ncbi:arabinogalactan-protein 5 [Hibiscus syriacus]|uniref:Arabinogalactan-protein 5 n=1 Tax=Hibiscus syriacus TaxID=106335 RepID=A0A6A3AB61_HIBSY|nr:putative clathrin assembly protein At4g40080 [Hibiscus syriacus]KAE8701714.1 arabinogalactan-protein 5 [Hibiscus syriacus]
MGYRTRLSAVFGLLKDKGSMIKTTLSTKRHKASVRRVILRATTHGSYVPPADHRIAAVIALGHGSRATACTCIQAVMDRLHRTRNSTVALKCLYTIHNIIGKGSYILKDQLAMYPSFGGRNFLNLSTFRDDSDPEAIEMSAWVRWYAGMLEQNLMVSRMLGYHLNSPPRSKNRNKILDSELLKEIEVLINFADHLSTVPDSLYLQRESLVYESVRLVSEDYRLVQREIFVRVAELGARTTILSLNECTEFLSSINRLDGCKERVSLLLVNRNRNDDLWDLIKGTKENLVATMKKEEEGKMVVTAVGNESRKLTGFSELYRLASRGRWIEF